jgi:SAM-dependent methyltransferase
VTDLPPTRWELAGDTVGYGERFVQLIGDGADVTGEARLADTLAPRGARILDAGSGMGRIGAALHAAGHRVTAVEKDPELIAISRELYPELTVIRSDILGITPAVLEHAGAPASYDVIVLVGNVIVLAAEGTEVRLLATLRDLLAPGGRILVGFHPQDGPAHARDYPFGEFSADVAAAGLVVQQHFGTYELHPPAEDYVVALLAQGQPLRGPAAP